MSLETLDKELAELYHQAIPSSHRTACNGLMYLGLPCARYRAFSDRKISNITNQTNNSSCGIGLWNIWGWQRGRPPRFSRLSTPDDGFCLSYVVGKKSQKPKAEREMHLNLNRRKTHDVTEKETIFVSNASPSHWPWSRAALRAPGLRRVPILSGVGGVQHFGNACAYHISSTDWAPGNLTALNMTNFLPLLAS